MARREFPPAHAAVPNLAPMIDVVMVILIFFMLGTTFAISEGLLAAQLPSQIGPGGGAAVSIVPSVRVLLRKQPGGDGCRIAVMGQELGEGGFDALSRFLDQKRRDGADPGGRIQIAAEPAVRYQHVISAMDACVRAGFSNLQINISGRGAAKITQTP
jgi:biopolymer transport protein ExbD